MECRFVGKCAQGATRPDQPAATHEKVKDSSTEAKCESMRPIKMLCSKSTNAPLVHADVNLPVFKDILGIRHFTLFAAHYKLSLIVCKLNSTLIC
jgi:hypothetical protein